MLAHSHHVIEHHELFSLPQRRDCRVMNLPENTPLPHAGRKKSCDESSTSASRCHHSERRAKAPGKCAAPQQPRLKALPSLQYLRIVLPISPETAHISNHTNCLNRDHPADYPCGSPFLLTNLPELAGSNSHHGATKPSAITVHRGFIISGVYR